MIGYFDASALVPLLLHEPTSPLCRELWANATGQVTSNLSYAEVSAALASAERSGRISKDQHQAACDQRDRMFDDLTEVTVDEITVRLAGRHAVEHALRGYDSVHCATASRLASPALIAITGDRALAEAWRSLGVYAIDTVALSQR